MIGILGESLLILCGTLSFIHLFKSVRAISSLIFLFLLGAFSLFAYAHINNHFELLNVFLHSHTHKPLLYKIAGTWASHEGSMLLWCFLLSLYQWLFSHTKLSDSVKRTGITLFTLLQLSFLLFLYLASNPFERFIDIPLEGQDLNPVLQDMNLALHPPHLYLGTLGFAVPFVLSLSLLLNRKTSQHCFKQLYAFSLIAQTFLTIGIVLGSVWAYYELGWGGWWFFDPVENLALIPWLLGLIQIHITLIAHKQGKYQRLSLLLGIIVFLSCLLSLTLIRSGTLSSIHSFGVDEKRGILLLILFLFWTSFGIFIYLKHRHDFSNSFALAFDRSTFMLIGALFIFLSCIAMLIGTFSPLITNLLGWSYTLDAAFYSQTFIPLWLPCLILLPLAVTMPWLSDIKTFKSYSLTYLIISTSLFSFLALYNKISLFIALYLATSATLLWVSFQYLLNRFSWGSLGQPIAHSGFALCVIGIALSSALSTECHTLMAVGDKHTIDNISFTLTEVKNVDGPNYNALQASFTVNDSMSKLQAEERLYWTQGTRHLETALTNVNGLSQVLIMLSQSSHKNVYTVKIIYKPYINLMWGGFICMILGLILSSLMRFQRISNLST